MPDPKPEPARIAAWAAELPPAQLSALLATAQAGRDADEETTADDADD